MKSKLQIYALIVCFSAMLSGVVSLATACYSMIELAKPELTMNSFNYTKHQTNDAFWESMNHRRSEREEAIVRPSEDVLTAKRNESYRVALQAEAREGLQSLVNAAIYLFFSTLLYLIHWRLVKRVKSQESDCC